MSLDFFAAFVVKQKSRDKFDKNHPAESIFLSSANRTFLEKNLLSLAFVNLLSAIKIHKILPQPFHCK